jgi:hypothetical protein
MESRHGIGVARALLAMVFVSRLSLAGCVLPPPVDEDPARQNMAPRLVPESFSPDPTTGWPRTMDDPDCPYTFRAATSDPDPTDTIYWRAFIDYNLQPDTTPTRDLIAQDGRFPPPESGIGDLEQPISISVNSGNELFIKVPSPVVHFVDLVVSDRPFDNGVEPRGRVPQGEGKTANFVWPVLIVDNPSDGICNQ